MRLDLQRNVILSECIKMKIIFRVRRICFTLFVAPSSGRKSRLRRDKKFHKEHRGDTKSTRNMNESRMQYFIGKYIHSRERRTQTARQRRAFTHCVLCTLE